MSETKVVPTTPTEIILAAGNAALAWGFVNAAEKDGKTDAAVVYQFMLAAAPSVPAADERAAHYEECAKICEAQVQTIHGIKYDSISSAKCAAAIRAAAQKEKT